MNPIHREDLLSTAHSLISPLRDGRFGEKREAFPCLESFAVHGVHPEQTVRNLTISYPMRLSLRDHDGVDGLITMGGMRSGISRELTKRNASEDPTMNPYTARISEA